MATASIILVYLLINIVGQEVFGLEDKNYFKFIPDFLVHKNVYYAVFHLCWSRAEINHLHKDLNKLLISSMFISSKHSAYYEDFIEQDVFFQPVSYVIDLRCPHLGDVLRMYSEKKSRFHNNNKYESVYKWLILHNNLTSGLEFLKDIKIRMDSDITLSIAETDLIQIYNVYKLTPHPNDMIKSHLGIWSQNTKLKFSGNHSSMVLMRNNFYQRQLRIGTVRTFQTTLNTEDYLLEYREHDLDIINKFNYGLFLHVKDLLNFSMNLSESDKWFGGIIYGGMNDGIAKLLYQNKIDMAATSGLLKPQRVRFVDFLMPVFPHRTCFVFLNPGIFSGIHNEFLTPFSKTTWISTLFTGLLIMMVVKVTFCSIRSTRKIINKTTWITAFLITISTFCQQGSPIVPTSLAGRFLLIVLLTFNILLYNYYTSSIVSSLLNSKPETFTTINELAHSKLEMGTDNIVYVNQLFEVTNDSDIKYLYQNKLLLQDGKTLKYVNPEDGVENIQLGGYAYHSEPSRIYSTIERKFTPSQICELSEINLFQPSVLATMAPKRSQYRKFFLHSYRRLSEAGIIKREQLKWFPRKPYCMSSADLRPIGIEQSSAAILFLFIGLVLSIVFLLIENLHNCYKLKITK